MRTNEQTRSRRGRGTRGDGHTPSALRAARGEGPGPGGRGAPQLPGRAMAAPATLPPPAAAARPSTSLHHCSPCTHTCTRSHTRTAGLTPTQEGKRGVRPLTGRRDPHREGQEPPRHSPLALSPQREPEGQEAGAGRGGAGLQGAWRPLAPSPRAGRRSYDLETDLELSRGTLGPFSQPGLQWPSCLQCHECIVSFINFKYKQNKNHIFLRQQQFSR